MTKQPLVSIVIMTCNRQNLLKNAIESAFQQSYTNTEIICILGMNSVDMSEEMLTELKAKNLIKFNKNYGNRIDARNKAFEMATGKYVCFLDDDDSMLSNRIQKQVEFLESNPDIDIVSCSTMLNNKIGLMHTFKHLTNFDINDLLFKGMDIDEVVNFQSCMFRKESIDKAYGDKTKFDKLFISGGEGQFFLYDCLFNHQMKIENISDTIYIYYVGQAGNSLTNMCDPVFYNEHIYGKSFDEKFEFVRNFRNNYPEINESSESVEETTEKPKRTRKKKATEETTEKPKRTRKKKATEEAAEKPKRTRKKKATESAEEAAEKPKRTRKKKATEEATEETTEKPKRTRKKKTTESVEETTEKPKRTRKKKA